MKSIQELSYKYYTAVLFILVNVNIFLMEGKYV
nr:MAG TPA: hypothetical protein [Caudoviricetes sp.]